MSFLWCTTFWINLKWEKRLSLGYPTPNSQLLWLPLVSDMVKKQISTAAWPWNCCNLLRTAFNLKATIIYLSISKMSTLNAQESLTAGMTDCKWGAHAFLAFGKTAAVSWDLEEMIGMEPKGSVAEQVLVLRIIYADSHWLVMAANFQHSNDLSHGRGFNWHYICFLCGVRLGIVFYLEPF